MTGKADYKRQDRNGQTPDKLVSDLWFKAPEHDKEINQGHHFHDFELMQDKYLRNLDKIYPRDEDSDTYQLKDYRHMQEEAKINKMSKLRREVEFLERGMQWVRTKFRKLKQDPTLNTFHMCSRTKTKTVHESTWLPWNGTGYSSSYTW